jgi:NADH-quinone oxidoreductase subunit C
MPEETVPGLTIRRIQERFPGDVLGWHAFRGDDTVTLRREAVVDVCRFLKHEPDLAYNLFIDLTVVDHLPREPRFEVVIHLYSIPHKHRVRLKVGLEEADPVMDTLTVVWKGTDWFEREAWDLYGVTFRGHPDLRRVLLYEEFKGHPLRKDYPIDQRQPLIGPKN